MVARFIPRGGGPRTVTDAVNERTATRHGVDPTTVLDPAWKSQCLPYKRAVFWGHRARAARPRPRFDVGLSFLPPPLSISHHHVPQRGTAIPVWSFSAHRARQPRGQSVTRHRPTRANSSPLLFWNVPNACLGTIVGPQFPVYLNTNAHSPFHYNSLSSHR